jgi:hypothetical protein
MLKHKSKVTFFLAVIFVLCLAFPPSLAQKGSRGGSSRSTSSKSSSKSTNGKTVHVKGYTRKDGTYVPPYDRAAPGTATSASSASNVPSVRPRSIETTRDKHGRIKRSAAAKHEFMLTHPCPITGSTNGKCPGYVIDHINPLACGGSDAPSNMQWQTKDAAKSKDKWERAGCR